MPTQTVLSFDPGLGNLGWCCYEILDKEFFYIKSGIFEQKKVKTDIPEKLMISHRFINQLFLKYGADIVAYEKMFFRGRSDSAASTIKVIGIIQLISACSSIEQILEVSPPTLKKFMTGSGKADKKEVQKHTIKKMLEYETESPESQNHIRAGNLLKAKSHEIDAIAVGLWAFEQLRSQDGN